MKWALIVNESVAEITDINPEGRFHPSLVWVEIPESQEVLIGDLYVNGEFTSAPPPPPAQIIINQQERISALESAVAALMGI